jgi:hypothetical protein
MFDGKVEKLVDNFASSPGSGHFSELQGKVSHMQQEASRVLATVNSLLKGVINLIYDLKEFKIRLSSYDAANSEKPEEREAGILSLKQIWMDRVDVQRGQGSINAMSSGNLNFVTLRDAFLAAKSLDQIEKELDLNERVKRILKPRFQEFLEWKKRSEQELRKRFEIEKIYLKSQVDALKLNARWAKPYLKAAQQLSPSEKFNNIPDLVNAFNSIYMELCLMGRNKINVNQRVIDKDLPPNFSQIKDLREYNIVVFVDFNFRGIPSKAGQHYVFGGRAVVNFRAYALNKEEIDLLKKKMSESDLDDSLKLVQGMTDDSLLQLKIDLDEFLGDKESKKQEKEKKESDDSNPFSALFSFFKSENKNKTKESSKETEQKEIKKDSYAEKYIRNLAEADAINNCFEVFDKYKKAHGMATFPYRDDAEVIVPKGPFDL